MLSLCPGHWFLSRHRSPTCSKHPVTTATKPCRKHTAQNRVLLVSAPAHRIQHRASINQPIQHRQRPIGRTAWTDGLHFLSSRAKTRDDKEGGINTGYPYFIGRINRIINSIKCSKPNKKPFKKSLIDDNRSSIHSSFIHQNPLLHKYYW